MLRSVTLDLVRLRHDRRYCTTVDKESSRTIGNCAAASPAACS